MKQTKYDRYRAISDELLMYFEPAQDSLIQKIVAGLKVSFSDIDRWLSDPTNPVTKSQLATGLEQGLFDLYDLLLNNDSSSRDSFINMFVQACKKHDPSLLEKIHKKADKILARGKIRNESEFYIVRNKVDQLGVERACEQLIAQFQSLLDNYEFG